MQVREFESDDPRIWCAIDVVEKGCRLARQVQRDMAGSAIQKDDRSPVTVADFAIQALIGRRLGQTFPEDLLVGEESADQLREPDHGPLVERITGYLNAFEPGARAEDILSWIDRGKGQSAKRFWVVDPIDGTKGFLRDAQYAIALAYVEEGQVQLGVLGCPRLQLSCERSAVRTDPVEQGCLIVASRGRGAWMRGLEESRYEPLSVSSVADAAAAVVVRSVESGHTNVDRLGTLIACLGTQEPPVAMDSQAKYGLLAAGQADLLLRLLSPARPDYREKIWDQAPGAIVVEEAGGTITDLDGIPLDFSTGRKLLRNRGVVASNGRLHESILQALRRVEREA